MSPTVEQIHYSTETFNECSRLVHSGRVQAGIQYLMRRWRAIPEALHTRFLHAAFLTLPADTQAAITDLLLVRSREAGITERTAALRHQIRQDRAQTAWLDAAEVGINAAYRKRWHRLCGMAALCALAALLLFVDNAL
jgi:protein involved in temperature-dependent protein secretion